MAGAGSRTGPSGGAIRQESTVWAEPFPQAGDGLQAVRSEACRTTSSPEFAVGSKRAPPRSGHSALRPLRSFGDQRRYPGSGPRLTLDNVRQMRAKHHSTPSWRRVAGRITAIRSESRVRPADAAWCSVPIQQEAAGTCKKSKTSSD